MKSFIPQNHKKIMYKLVWELPCKFTSSLNFDFECWILWFIFLRLRFWYVNLDFFYQLFHLFLFFLWYQMWTPRRYFSIFNWRARNWGFEIDFNFNILSLNQFFSQSISSQFSLFFHLKIGSMQSIKRRRRNPEKWIWWIVSCPSLFVFTTTTTKSHFSSLRER